MLLSKCSLSTSGLHTPDRNEKEGKSTLFNEIVPTRTQKSEVDKIKMNVLHNGRGRWAAATWRTNDKLQQNIDRH